MRKLHSWWHRSSVATGNPYFKNRTKDSYLKNYGQVVEAFPKTETSFLNRSIYTLSSLWLGSVLKTVIDYLLQTKTLSVQHVICVMVLLLGVSTTHAQLNGCDIAIVPDDLDMQDRVQANLDDMCTACGIYGGNNGSPGMPPNGATGCAVIQFRQSAMPECDFLIIDPQSSEKTDYYFDPSVMEAGCFSPDGSTEGQGMSITIEKADLTLNNGFYHLVVCSQSGGNRFFEIGFGCCPNPGADVEVFACEDSEDEIDLFAALEGADEGGAWMRQSGSGGIFNMVEGTYTPGMDGTNSVFTYTLPQDQNLPDCDYDSEVTVTLSDVLEPELICKNLELALSYNDPEIIDADTLIEAIRDLCGEIASVQARRMENPAACGYPDNLILSDSIAFCCADVGDTIMVELSVTDDSGNTATCMAEVTVVDNVPPLIWTCVDDITVSCSYPIDLADLSEFGTLEINQDDVDEIILDDPEFNGSDGGQAFDGMFQENCPGWFIRTVVTDLRECNKGDIIRKFYVTDASGNSDSCEQTITIVDPEQFDWYDITWPVDVDYEDCDLLAPNPGPGPDPDITGWPTYNLDDYCSQPTATFKDLFFDDPTSGCLKIQRTWKVIDWCYYDKITKEGSWTWQQYIKIINTEAPEWEDHLDTLQRCVAGADCAGDQTFTIEASDDCTEDEDLAYSYEIDVDNDGDIDDSGESNEFTIYLEPGTHKIYWEVEDRCGNDTTTQQLVIVRECKAPTPICLFGLAASLSEEGETEIWAKDFNNKSFDNCTSGENLIFSFSADTDSMFMTLTCDDLGRKPIEMWVTDEAGNQSYCETYIDVQDSHEVCPGDGGGEMLTHAKIGGHISTEIGTAVGEVQVNLSGPELDTYVMTDEKGEYAFESLDAHYNYEVIPTKDNDPLAGVSTLDLVIVQQHILGIKKFESPYKLIAADVNNSESITAVDLIQLRKMILGKYDNFPENNSWRFVESVFGIIDNTSPWPFIEGMFIEDLDEDKMHNDFVAVKVGDVNGSVEEKLRRNVVETRSTEQWILTGIDREVSAGETFDVEITGMGLRQMIALQWTITVDSDKLSISGWKGVKMSVSDDHFGLIEGEGEHLTFAWTDLASKSFNNDVLMKVTFTARQSGKLSEMMQMGSTITPANGYNTSYEKVGVTWHWQDPQPGEVVLHQNTPNPFQERTTITFDLPKDMNATIELYDVSGKLMYQKAGPYVQGRNNVTINSYEMDGMPGVVYYVLKTADSNITKKMIMLR